MEQRYQTAITVLAIAILLACGSAAHAQSESVSKGMPSSVPDSPPSSEYDEHEATAREMMDACGAIRAFETSRDQIISMFKELNPMLSDETWDRFGQRLDPRELIERVLPIYIETYTIDELRQITEFYTSPIGRKVVEKMPETLIRSMAIGRQWGLEVAEEMARELAEEGVILQGV